MFGAAAGRHATFTARSGGSALQNRFRTRTHLVLLAAMRHSCQKQTYEPLILYTGTSKYEVRFKCLAPPACSSRVLAKEQASIGGLKVVNYAPGPMSTDMSREIQTAEQFEAKVESGEFIDARVSAEKCVRLALRGAFVSGSHIDFFDEEND